MDDPGDMYENLLANLKHHDDYMHYLNIEYPKQLDEQLRDEIVKNNLKLLKDQQRKEMEAREEKQTSARRHRQILFATIFIPIIVLAVTIWAMVALNNP